MQFVADGARRAPINPHWSASASMDSNTVHFQKRKEKKTNVYILKRAELSTLAPKNLISRPSFYMTCHVPIGRDPFESTVAATFRACPAAPRQFARTGCCWTPSVFFCPPLLAFCINTDLKTIGWTCASIELKNRIEQMCTSDNHSQMIKSWEEVRVVSDPSNISFDVWI